MSQGILIGPRGVFVDTSGFFALLVQRDADHPKATDVQTQLIAQRRPLVTTNWVLAEAHALMLGRVGRKFALRTLLAIDRSNTSLIRVSTEDERRARGILAQYNDKDFSLTDATSFAVMERLQISEAFTFDHHFAQFGVQILGRR